MSVASQLEQLETDITSAYSAINTKGGTIPAHKNTNNLATAISSISTGGGGSISDYFNSSANEEDYDVKGLLKQIPSINMSSRTSLDYYFDGCSSLVSLPNLTNCSDIQSAGAMASNCPVLVNVPYYYMPNCQVFSGAFFDSELLSNQSLDNIMQMCINCDNENYQEDRVLEAIIPESICYKVENLAHYQDFLNAGWVVYYSDL